MNHVVNVVIALLLAPALAYAWGRLIFSMAKFGIFGEFYQMDTYATQIGIAWIVILMPVMFLLILFFVYKWHKAE